MDDSCKKSFKQKLLSLLYNVNNPSLNLIKIKKINESNNDDICDKNDFNESSSMMTRSRSKKLKISKSMKSNNNENINNTNSNINVNYTKLNNSKNCKFNNYKIGKIKSNKKLKLKESNSNKKSKKKLNLCYLFVWFL